jgi:hypothetical protein
MDWMDNFYSMKMVTKGGVEKMADIGLLPFFFVLLTALVVSLFISHLYLRFYGTKGTGSTLHRAFPLLGVAITSIFVSLQFSIPLSLGLLGALSIVRFRTPIKDPEEIGFILLVIATSLGCATFNLPFVLLVLVISLVGLTILKFDKKIFRKNANEGILIVKIPTEVFNNSHDEIIRTIKAGLTHSSIDSILEEGPECTLTYKFSRFAENQVSELRTSLKAVASDASMNIFYNNSSN